MKNKVILKIIENNEQFLIVDIVLIPTITAQVKSYNIWLTYSGLSHVNNNTLTNGQTGNANNYDWMGAYRVAGVQASYQVVQTTQATSGRAIHRVAFKKTKPEFTISVGGSMWLVINSTITFINPLFNEPRLEKYTL